MDPVLQDSKRRSITKKEDIRFSVKKSGLYAIVISARCKGEKQGTDADDEDLRIEIDGRHFGELTNPNRYFDGPAAFTGGRLHNSKETICFFLNLTEGRHMLSLFPDKTATLESLQIFKVSSNASIEKITLVPNITAEDGNTYPWIVFAFVDVSISAIDLTLSLTKRFIDSDDVKIIIDGKIQRNFRNSDIVRKLWYFIASKDSNSKQSATFSPHLPKGLHYIELWADRMPVLNSIDFALGTSTPNKIQEYKPNKFNHDYNKFDEFIISATGYWSNFFSRQTYPPPEVLDPNLVKAIIYRESKLGYYPDAKIVDVMQVWDPRNPSKDAMLGKTVANEFITPQKVGHMQYSYPKSKVPPTVTTKEESIFWGVRWLYHKAQFLQETRNGQINTPYERQWRSWPEAVSAYNGNPELVEEYVKEVFSIYNDGVDLEGNVLWEKS